MSGLALFLLGPPRVEVDGQPLAVDTRMAVALLAYLALNPQPQSRDSLAALLWPEYDQTNARANLRRTLSALKRGLNGRWVVGEREQIRLEGSSDVSIDVDQFRTSIRATFAHGHPTSDVCPACIEPLARADELFRGPFLAGFSLRESAAFDEWQAFQAETHTRELATVLDRLTDALASDGQFERAIASARRWVALDPLHEPAHRRLMLLFAWAGDRAAALRQHRECVRVLDQELGVPPLAETTELADAIKSGQEPSPPARLPSSRAEAAALAPAAPARPEVFPLVGRAREWSSLLDAYSRADPDGAVVSLQGEAGIGKSRLADELLEHVRACGGQTLVLRCYQGETHIAYAPVAEALRTSAAAPDVLTRLGDLPDHVLAEAGRLLPELATGRAQPTEGPGAQERFIDALTQLVLALTRSTAPAAVLVDDAHWADEGTFDLLTHLCRRAHGKSLCLILTFRAEEVLADDRLRRLLAEVRRDGRLTQIVPARLAPGDIQKLVRAAAPDLPVGALEEVVRNTEGLPFFVVEYLRALAEGQPSAELPGSVRELLHSRLHGISETAAQVLATAAVIGRSFEFDIVHQASGRSDDETVSALEELARRGLICEVRDPAETRLRFDFGHAWLRDIVYDEASLTRRRLLHRRVAEALSPPEVRRSVAPGPRAGEIARHYQLAGHDSQAAEFFRIAGEYARAVYANAEALTHFQAALALGHPATATLHEAIADLQTLNGQYTAAVTSYGLAAALCQQVDLARVEHKLANLYCRRGEWERAESHYLSAEAEFSSRAEVASDVAAREAEPARLFADWSLATARRGDLTRAAELADRALRVATQADDAHALIAAHNALGIVASRRGDPTTGRHHHERSLALAEMLDDRSGRVAALNNLALARSAAGELDQALATASAALELCSAQGDRHREAALHNNLADLLHAAGRIDESMAHLKQAVTIFAEVGSAADPTQPEIWKLTEW